MNDISSRPFISLLVFKKYFGSQLLVIIHHLAILQYLGEFSIAGNLRELLKFLHRWTQGNTGDLDSFHLENIINSEQVQNKKGEQK